MRRRRRTRVTGRLAGLVAMVVAGLLCVPAAASALPADRAYEMVSPPDKNDGDVGAGGFAGSHRASADGNSLLYMSLGGWGDAPTNSITNVYLARRGDDAWSNHSALMRMFPFSTLAGAGVFSASRDFSKVITVTNMDPDTGEEYPNPNGEQFILDPVTKQYERITADPVDGVFGFSSSTGDFHGTADYSELLFNSYTSYVPEAVSLSKPVVYRYANGQHTVQSRDESGTPIGGAIPDASFSHRSSNPVSRDGKVFFFTNSNGPVYRRDLSGPTPETVAINAEENSLEDPSLGDASFVGADVDATVAYFVSSQRLVDEDTDNTSDIYQYDHSKPSGQRLTLVTVDSEPGDGEGTVARTYGVTDDGERVFFASPNQLVGGEPTETGSKLYTWADGELEFVANVGSPELRVVDGVLSANGEYFGFLSAASGITPEDNGGQAQAYLYEVETGNVFCVSCVGGGEANTEPARWRDDPNLGMIEPFEKPVRNVSTEGHVFFETPEPLLPSDTNGKYDVYVWQDGELDLLSTGRDDDDSEFMDASEDGSTVFFATRERLVKWDVDQKLDAYAARVGGGLPDPPAPPVPCEGDGCQNDPPAPPGDDALGSENYSGPGNPKVADCGELEADLAKAKRKQRKLSGLAKKLERKAKQASGKKAKRLSKRAKKAKRKAKAAKRKAQRVRAELRECRRNG